MANGLTGNSKVGKDNHPTGSYYFSHANRHIFNLMYLAVSSGKNTIFLTGQSGVGKKRIVEEVLKRHESYENSIFVTITSGLSSEDFLSTLYQKLKIPKSTTKYSIGTIAFALANLRTETKRPIALVLYNLELVTDQKILNLISQIISGIQQAKIDRISLIATAEKKSQSDPLSMLRNLFTLSLEVEPMNRRATFDYIDNYLASSSEPEIVFTRDAKYYIYTLTVGNIGFVNNICHLTKLVAKQLDLKRVTRETLDEKVMPYLVSLPNFKTIAERNPSLQTQGLPLATRLMGSNIEIPVASKEFNIIFSENTEDTGVIVPSIAVKGYKRYINEKNASIELYKKCVSFCEKEYKAAASNTSLDVMMLEQISDEIIQSLIRGSTLLGMALQDYIADPLICQTANAAILSAAMGIRMGLSPENLKKMTMLGLTHDIGKAKIPPSILNKPGKLAEHEVEIMKNVPTYSREIVMKSGEPYTWLGDLTYQASEREDGKGYPNGLKGDQIDPLVKILMVADTFEAFTHNRTWRTKIAPYDALQAIGDMKGASFDSSSVTALFRAISVYPIGCYIQLSTGEIGEVIESNPDALMKPVVLTKIDANGAHLPEPKMVDLRGESLIFINKVLDDSEVAALNIELSAMEDLQV